MATTPDTDKKIIKPRKASTATATKRAPKAKALIIPDLPLATEGSEHIPTHASPYHDHDGMLSMLALGLGENLPVLVMGDTGTGKTSAIRYLAKLHGAPFRRINLNGGTTVDELTGRIMLNKEGTVWVDGALTEAMRKGFWIVLDEINACGADVLFILHSLLDDDRMVVLTEHNGEVVRPHPAFRVFATANPSGDYAGTREMNKALLSRFPIVLTANYPDEVKECAIVAERVPDLESDIIVALVKTAHGARESHKKGALDFIFSTRDIINTAYITARLGGTVNAVKSAMKACIAGKCSKEDAGAISDILKMHLVDPSKATTATAETPLEALKRMATEQACGNCGMQTHSFLAELTPGSADVPAVHGNVYEYQCNNGSPACAYRHWWYINAETNVPEFIN